MSNLQEKKEDYILSLDNSGQLTKIDIIEQNLNAIDFGYELCQKEYEEKLRWIPPTEKLPEDCPELFLRKVITKQVLVKRKWNDTGEIVIELNSRFSPSPKIGFVWNYDYPKSEIIEWRSFL